MTGAGIPAIGAMWERCSLATRIARFHAPVRDIPASYLTAVLADPAASILAVREPAGMVAYSRTSMQEPAGQPVSSSFARSAWRRSGLIRTLYWTMRRAARMSDEQPRQGMLDTGILVTARGWGS